MEIKIQRLTPEQIQKLGIKSWPVWEKEISRFDWHYDCIEECLFLDGEVTVETKDGKSVNFSKGDFVTFPRGLSCTWIIKSPVRKHYNFR